jgi:hypothetical protein
MQILHALLPPQSWQGLLAAVCLSGVRGWGLRIVFTSERCLLRTTYSCWPCMHEQGNQEPALWVAASTLTISGAVLPNQARGVHFDG